MEKKSKTIDPALIGEWRHNKTRYLYNPEGYIFLGDVEFPITIKDNANKLIYGSEYYRFPGTPNTGTIVGDWRSDEQEETKHFHIDGSMLTHFDGESLAYFGTYTCNGNKLTTLEYRGKYETNGDEIIYDVFDSTIAKSKYSINQNILTLTDPSGTVLTLTKFP